MGALAGRVGMRGGGNSRGLARARKSEVKRSDDAVSYGQRTRARRGGVKRYNCNVWHCRGLHKTKLVAKGIPWAFSGQGCQEKISRKLEALQKRKGNKGKEKALDSESGGGLPPGEGGMH